MGALTREFDVSMPVKDAQNMNDRKHWGAKDTLREKIAGRVHYSNARQLDRMERATIWVGVEKSQRAAYDAQNLQATAKVIVDTLVRMGKLPEDDNDHVIGPFLYHAGVDRSLKNRAGVQSVRFRFRMDPYGLPHAPLGPVSIYDPALLRWLAEGHRSASAEAIVERLTGVPVGVGTGWWPDHPEELRRCIALVRAVPAVDEHLHLMADVSERWAWVVESWDRLVPMADEGSETLAALLDAV